MAIMVVLNDVIRVAIKVFDIVLNQEYWENREYKNMAIRKTAIVKA
jgi:hypothetical protein